MSATMAATVVLDRVYLDVRCRLLDVAAALDRIERADGSDEALNDPRWRQLREGIAILKSDGADRAERIQMLFSDSYVPNWSRRGGERGSKIEDRR
jgi:hypothetical protein